MRTISKLFCTQIVRISVFISNQSIFLSFPPLDKPSMAKQSQLLKNFSSILPIKSLFDRDFNTVFVIHKHVQQYQISENLYTLHKLAFCPINIQSHHYKTFFHNQKYIHKNL